MWISSRAVDQADDERTDHRKQDQPGQHGVSLRSRIGYRVLGIGTGTPTDGGRPGSDSPRGGQPEPVRQLPGAGG